MYRDLPQDLQEHPDLFNFAEKLENRRNNPLRIVVAQEKTETSLRQANLIKLTEKLAEEARNGTLIGVGGFALYEDRGFIFGLEGEYLHDPVAAIVPLKFLDKRVMDQIDSEGK